MTKPEGITIKPGISAAYLTDKAHMMSYGIPSWSARNRDPAQTFVQTILNSTEQCRYASMKESICSVNPSAPNGSEFYVMNPWTGGAFNVFVTSASGSSQQFDIGACDTDLLDERIIGA
jgi:hypothetical protein